MSMLPKACVIQVIKVVTTDGEGTQESPKRRVVRYYDFAGNLLATYDQWDEEKQ